MQFTSMRFPCLDLNRVKRLQLAQAPENRNQAAQGPSNRQQIDITSHHAS
jgi:hypothetical protein